MSARKRHSVCVGVATAMTGPAKRNLVRAGAGGTFGFQFRSRISFQLQESSGERVEVHDSRVYSRWIPIRSRISFEITWRQDMRMLFENALIAAELAVGVDGLPHLQVPTLVWLGSG